VLDSVSWTAIVTGAHSTTAHELRRFRRLLLVLTVLVLAGTTSAFVIVQETAASAAQHTAPAIVATSSADYALAEADSDAMRGFALGAVSITGPGSDYEAQISLAEQNLEQVAELNEDATGSQDLLLIDSNLASYRQLVEQAHADYTAGSAELGFVEVAYASQLMHTQVLDQLTDLRNLEQAELTGQATAFSLSGWAVPTWALPTLALLIAMVVAQRYLSARFRRTVNWALAGATVLLLVLAAGTSMVFLAEGRMAAARDGTNRLVADRTMTFAALSVPTQAGTMADRLNRLCDTKVSDTNGSDNSDNDNSHRSGCVTAIAAKPPPAQVEAAATANDEAGAAAGNGYLEYVIPSLGVVIGVLVLIGLRPGIDEYRRRKT
jgi:hypothetical protein